MAIRYPLVLNGTTIEELQLADSIDFTSASISGDLTFTGTGARVKANFSDPTATNRLLFQTSTANSTTAVGIMPNGTGSTSIIYGVNSSTLANASYFDLRVSGSGNDVRLSADYFGAGMYLPITFYTGGLEQVRITANSGAAADFQFSQSGTRITGNFSDPITANRVLFQTSTANSTTAVGIIPKGTGATSIIYGTNNSDPTNASYFDLRVSGSGNDVRLTSDYYGAGTYLPITLYTGGSERVRIDTAGRVGIGAVPTAARSFLVGANLTGSTTAVSVFANGVVQSDVTSSARYFQSSISTAAASFTAAEIVHFYANQSTIGATSAVTNQIGFSVASTLTGATNNYGFYSNIASGSGRYNFYAAGTADNYFGGPVQISASSTSNALQITQAGTGPALLVNTSGTPNNSPFVVNTNGQVGLGIGATSIPGGASIYIASDGTTNVEMDLFRAGNAVGGQNLLFIKSRGTVAAPLIVASGDQLGNIIFRGRDDAGNNVQGAAIQAAVDGTPGTNDMPGRLVFSTTRDGASSPSEAFRVNSSQNTLFGRTYAGNERIGIGGGTSGLTGGTSAAGIFNDTQVSSAQTANYDANATYIGTVTAAFTLTNLRHYRANQGIFNSGSAVTNQFGFIADGTLVGATNNYGFYSSIASASGRYNFYAAGTADNYFGGPVVVSTSSTSAALRVTQTGSGNALLVEDDTNPDSSPFVVDTAGRVLIGNTSAVASLYSVVPAYELFSNGGISGQYAYSASSSGPAVFFNKSRNATIGSHTIVNSGDTCGELLFGGSDGTAFIEAARIQGVVDGTPGTNDMPGRLVFSTTADGASSPTEAVRIDSAQNIGIGGASAAGYIITANKNITGNTNAVGIRIGGAIQSDVTSSVALFSTRPSTAAASFTLGSLFHYITDTQTLGAGSSVTNQYGFYANATLTGAASNYGFYSNVPGAAGRWNIYVAGTADNFFQGPIKSNGTVAGGYVAHAAGTTAMVLGSYNVVKVTPNATATYTTTIAPAGTKSSIIIVTSGTTSYTITFGTGFLTTGTLATGTVTAKTFVVNFVSDGTTMIETSRTVAM